MKKNSIKNILLSICLALFMVTALTGLAFSSLIRPRAARAAETATWKTGVFEMEDGVSLKLGEKGGLRFIMKMDKTVYDFVMGTENVEIGFIIAPKQLMLAANGEYLSMAKKVGGPIETEKIYQVEGESFYLANGCITNLKYDSFTYDFTAVGYIHYNGEVRYTDYNDYARNNLYDTVNAAVLNGYAKEVFDLETYTGTDDPNDEETGWYGTEIFPIVVENTEEYDALIKTANDNKIDLSDRTVVVNNNATSTQDFENEAYQPTIIAGELDEINKLIASLPDSVTMPNAIGMVSRIRDAEQKYNALTDTYKAQVENYAKLESLLTAIDGYNRVYKNDATDGTVIPSYVPNFTSTVGGSATTRTDDVYGNVLSVVSDAGGKAALSFANFPSVDKYDKLYFYVKVSVGCDIYLSDGISNDGWGDNWHNTWSVSGYWCNADTWRLIEIDSSSGYIGTNFALGFRTNDTDITFEISDIYGHASGAHEETELTFGTRVDSGETNEYGTVYNISREQWYIDNNNTNTIGTLQASKLANALPAGFEHFYFWMYNGTGTEYNFHLAGDVSGTWTDSADTTALKVGEWTKVIISAEDVELNKNGQWYVYILGGDGTGAAKDGWKISPFYAGPYQEYVYTDHADVKEVIALIDTIPDNVTVADQAMVESTFAVYNALTNDQKELVTNASKLTDAKSAIEVILLIDSINARDVDEDLVKEARDAYDALTDNAKSYVSNLATLEAYEAEIEAAKELTLKVNNVDTLIANLPDSVVMPDNLVFVPRIEAARNAYAALSAEGKGMVANYAKLKALSNAIKGYTTVHIQTLDNASVIPSHVPNFTSTIGGTASLGYDAYYGNYLKVTPDAGGNAAVQFINFPDVSKYTKIYFNIRVVGTSCDIYLSDGITNDGWGDGWHNTWSMSGFWTNDGNWVQKEIDPSTGILSSNWALGLRTDTTDVSFEITDIVGVLPELGTNSGLTFGTFADSGTSNAYGTVYNLTQGWASDTDMGAFNQYALSKALATGHDSLRFYIYNPNESAVDFKFAGDMNSWDPQGDYVTKLPAQAWTEVIVTPEIVTQGDSGTWCINVTTGAGTSGWQISPIYSFNSIESAEDEVDMVQARIDALNTENIDEAKVKLAREAYEALPESSKELVTITKLITCETSLYGDVTTAPFIVDGATSYKIYIEDAALKTIATYVNEQLESATGAKLSIISNKPTTITKYRYAIVFGHEDLYEGLGLTLPEKENIGLSGYAIKRIGRTVFIVAYGEDGYRMGALAFLREVIGYDMISEDCIVYEKDGSTLPAFNLTEKPSFAYRQQQTYMTEDEVLGMGLSAHTDIWIPSAEGWDMHNALHYLPVETYGSSHPNWYTSDKKQICPTAGGTSAEFNAMVDVIVANMMVRINAYPTIENISFSIMDSVGGDACTCTRCNLYTTLYGNGGFSAAWVDLMNAINAKIQAQIGERELNIAFLAYRSTETAPANDDFSLMKRYEIDDNGNYTQTSEDLKCDDNVMVWLAPIDGKYAENLNHADNAATLATIKKWCALSNNVYLWMYGANFKYYMYPYNTWQASAESYKILAELGVKGAWSQSNETEATAFTDLKAYIDSKFMFNVNADYETVLNDYFTNYYGAASSYMRSMFDKIVTKCNEIEENNDGLGRGIYDNIENTSGFLGIDSKKYWEKSWMDELIALCDDAYAAIDADTTLSEEEKTVIKNRITKESLFPRYMLCTAFASSYSSTDKKEMRQAFKTDCEALGVTLYREADGELSSLYSEWGV